MSTKTIGSIVIIVILIIGVVTGLVMAQNKFKTYTNTAYNFSFQYPQNLFLFVLNSTTTAPELRDIAFVTAKKSNTHSDSNFFVVSRASTVENVFAYFKVPESVPKHLSDYVGYYQTHMSDFLNFPKGSVWSEEVVNGVNYYKLTAPEIESYFVEHDGAVYVLTFSTAAPEHKNLEKYISKVLLSFKFTN